MPTKVRRAERERKEKRRCEQRSKRCAERESERKGECSVIAENLLHIESTHSLQRTGGRSKQHHHNRYGEHVAMKQRCIL